MAYVLGFIAADGAVIDARKSSRTCYTSIKINDKQLLEQIKKVMSSKHLIYLNPARYNNFGKESYYCKQSYTLRFGSKKMFQDLVDLGITPRKSLRLKLPSMPRQYFNFFIRGYFDGDGCVNVYKNKAYPPIIQVIFTSGCAPFLKDLSKHLAQQLNIKVHNVISGDHAYQLKYKKRATLKVLKYMYKDLRGAPFLERKYNVAKPYLQI